VTPSIAEVLAERAREANLTLSASLSERLLAYYRLLTHWNRTINLTSLKDPVEAVDRLLIEPVAAVATLGNAVRGAAVIDIGSGGGSPAIPLALALDARRLVMVESRARKAAFLRAAAQEVNLNATVESARFEDVAVRSDLREQFDLVSVRAVRLDDALFHAAAMFLQPSGRLLLFGESLTVLNRTDVPRGT
jgi:16S rRNA (guanine527-N7)-methyltransferase